MWRDTAQQRFYQATRAFRDDADLSPVPPTTPACACCGRPWADVEDPGQAIAYRYQVPEAVTEWVCTACYTPRLKNARCLGIEKVMRGHPVGARLGMLPGAGGVVTADDALHLALPPGFMTKFKDGALSRQGRLHAKNSLSLLLSMVAADRLGAVEEGILFIEVWGRKPDILMGTMRLTRSLSELWCCSDKGASCIDLQSVIDSARWLHAHELAERAARPAFWQPLVNEARGRRDAAAMTRWRNKTLGAIGDPDAFLARLPHCPHTRRRLPGLMKAVMPWINGGEL